jgi:hypothetical protein
MKIAVITDTHWGFSPTGNRINLEMNEHIKEEKPDVILHCGDDNSSQYEEKVEYWEMMRKTFPKIPIGIVNGNHSFWDRTFLQENRPIEYKRPHSARDVMDLNMGVWDKNDITYIPDGMEIFKEGEAGGLFISGFDGWYHYDVNTNDRNFIPNYYLPEGREWLLRRTYAQFYSAMEAIKQHKKRGYATILVSHFGVVKKAADRDYKSNPVWGQLEREYFGADPNLEGLIENTDHYFFGHSHAFYEGIAENGTTKVMNVGSDYENPRVEFLEV